MTLWMLCACVNAAGWRRAAHAARLAAPPLAARARPPAMCRAASSQSLSARIREQVKLSEVARSLGVHVEERGGKTMARCPFHGDGNERTPSMSISDDRNSFYCFACHEKGTVIDFVMMHESLDYGGALSYFADEFGIEGDNERLNYRHARKTQISSAESDLVALHEAAAEAYCSALTRAAATPCANFLRERGVSHQAVSQFRLGFSPGGKWLTSKMLEQGFSASQLQSCGLSVPDMTNGELRDRWQRAAHLRRFSTDWSISFEAPLLSLGLNTV